MFQLSGFYCNVKVPPSGSFNLRTWALLLAIMDPLSEVKHGP